MKKQKYTASKSSTEAGTAWVMSFRHPLRKDPRGKQGRKVRRGLGTSDESKAQALVDEMNDLLRDTSWHSLTKRAEAERRFNPVVVGAFYDDIEGIPFNSWDIRNKVLPLPTRNEGYTQVMMVGTTGAGKTSLLRHLIGSHPKFDRFPSTSASRTTISDIEVISSTDELYQAVVTFFDEPTVNANVHECVANACTALWDDLTDDKLAERFLTHRDLRFRLGYIIGSWKQFSPSTAKNDDPWEYDTAQEEPSGSMDESNGNLPMNADTENLQDILKSYLERIKALAAEAKSRLVSEIEINLDDIRGLEKEAAQDLFEDLVQDSSGFDDLVNDIMDQVRKRFDRISVDNRLRTHPNGWPLAWEYQNTDRANFVEAVRRFSSNYAPAFGTLLTPLVDGIRIQGPFSPTFAEECPKLVLLDGEGLGHIDDSSAGIPSRIAKRFSDVDIVLLVDSAKAPMLEAPASILRQIAASGYQKKLALAFTHFDLVRGQANLPTFEAQREHVLSSVHQKLTHLRKVVGQPAVRAIERELDGCCFMLGYLDRPLTKENRGPVAELIRLIDFCEKAIAHAEQPQISPVYDTAGLVLAIQDAAKNFHNRWNAILGFQSSGSVRTAHWAEIKAFNRRVAHNLDDSEYRDLRPVADFVACLSESITRFLDKPILWKPKNHTDSEAEEALSRVQREVFARLHEFINKKLLRVPLKQWMEAFEHKGYGSTRIRAQAIRTIYDTSAPIPGPALDTYSEQFLREVRQLVHEAILEGGGELVSDVLS